MKKNIKKKK